jgi:hypothetical protein
MLSGPLNHSTVRDRHGNQLLETLVHWFLSFFPFSYAIRGNPPLSLGCKSIEVELLNEVSARPLLPWHYAHHSVITQFGLEAFWSDLEALGCH